MRTVLTDYAAVEGWALYAEQIFYEGGSTARGQGCSVEMSQDTCGGQAEADGVMSGLVWKARITVPSS